MQYGSNRKKPLPQETLVLFGSNRPVKQPEKVAKPAKPAKVEKKKPAKK
jgi:hypothetical protein